MKEKQKEARLLLKISFLPFYSGFKYRLAKWLLDLQSQSGASSSLCLVLWLPGTEKLLDPQAVQYACGHVDSPTSDLLRLSNNF